jgi:hypothetical protein
MTSTLVNPAHISVLMLLTSKSRTNVRCGEKAVKKAEALVCRENCLPAINAT